jgi:hypothetical protein
MDTFLSMNILQTTPVATEAIFTIYLIQFKVKYVLQNWSDSSKADSATLPTAAKK